LPIALALLIALGALTEDDVAQHVCLGELGLDGSIAAVAGVLPAAMYAANQGFGLICPKAQGGEAAWWLNKIKSVSAR
jgi:magnesium chelatase family protein